MAQGQLIATADCNTQEIILDVQGGTASGDFEVMFPDASTQTISGSLPLTVTSVFSGIHVFWNNSLDPGSSVTSVLPITLDVDYSNCAEIEDMSYCLFNLNNAYEKALCKNEKLAEIEKQKLDRAIQLVLLMEHLTECSENQTGCNVYGCTDSTAFNYNPNACMDDGSCLSSQSWDCISGNCIDPGTGNGTYATLSACQGNCVASPCGGSSTPCVPNTAGACTGTVSVPSYKFELLLAMTQLDDGNFPNQLTDAATICNVTTLNATLQGSPPTSSNPYSTTYGGDINNFTGLEGFVSLEYLTVAGNPATSLPNGNSLSFAPCLSEFNCASTNIDVSTLDFTQNPELEHVWFNGCTSNTGTLPLSPANNPKLKILRAIGLSIGSYTSGAYDFSVWPCLTKIQFNGNNITSFDFTGLTSLSYLDVSYNPMTTIDVSMCTALTFFHVGYCLNVTDIYLGSNIDLNNLYNNSGFTTWGSNPAVQIHVGTQVRVDAANLLWPNPVGTFVI